MVDKIYFSEAQNPDNWDNEWKIIECPACHKAGCKECQNLGFIRILKKEIASLN